MDLVFQSSAVAAETDRACRAVAAARAAEMRMMAEKSLKKSVYRRLLTITTTKC
jgi:hypothetical protein